VISYPRKVQSDEEPFHAVLAQQEKICDELDINAVIYRKGTDDTTPKKWIQLAYTKFGLN